VTTFNDTYLKLSMWICDEFCFGNRIKASKLERIKERLLKRHNEYMEKEARERFQYW
jgi:hypothetical protein